MSPRAEQLQAIFRSLAAIFGAVVIVNELVFWLSHLRHPGPAPYITLCAAGVTLLAIAGLLETFGRTGGVK